jgi:protein phosphatase
MSAYDWEPAFPPSSAKVECEFGARSRRGAARSVNEDHYLIARMSRQLELLQTSLPESPISRNFDEHGYAMAVADGMGGTGAGEVASRLALTTLLQMVLYFGKWNLRIDNLVAREIMDRAERFYRHVDSTVAFENLTGPTRGLQTTLTALFGAGRDLFFAHVGHSRAYLCRNQELMRLTRDHTVGRQDRYGVSVAPMVDLNVTARDLKHIITGTIGGGRGGPTIDLERFRLDDQDVVLLCTNGITDVLDERMVTEVLASGGPVDDIAARLVALTEEAGGEDDATALVGRYRVPADAE